jgi:hypothetical protein
VLIERGLLSRSELDVQQGLVDSARAESSRARAQVERRSPALSWEGCSRPRWSPSSSVPPCTSRPRHKSPTCRARSVGSSAIAILWRPRVPEAARSQSGSEDPR